jgi:O-antigen/teichoic acid export membrane protein
MAAATLATDLGNDLVTAVYGEDYSDAARVLPGLVAGTIAWAVTSIYLTEARVRHRHVATVAITLTLTAATLVPALILVPDEGLDGATQAFLVGNIAAAVVAFGCHLVVGRTVRGAPPEPLPIVVAASGESPA